MSRKLLTPQDVDAILRWPNGRAERMARKGKLAHVTLPDDSIRFTEDQLNAMTAERPATGKGVANAR